MNLQARWLGCSLVAPSDRMLFPGNVAYSLRTRGNSVISLLPPPWDTEREKLLLCYLSMWTGCSCKDRQQHCCSSCTGHLSSSGLDIPGIAGLAVGEDGLEGLKFHGYHREILSLALKKIQRCCYFDTLVCEWF